MRKIFIYIFLALILFVGGGVSYLLFTEGGLLFIFERGRRFIPGEVSAKSLRGRIIGPLQVGGIKYASDGFEVEVDRIDLDWKPSDLLSGVARISRFDSGGINVRIEETGPDGGPPEGLPGFKTPVAIAIDLARARDITITGAGSRRPLSIKEVSLKAEMDTEAARIVELKVEAWETSIRVSGMVSPQGAYPLDLNLAWAARPGKYEAYRGRGKVSGTLEELAIALEVTSPFNGDLAGGVSFLTEPEKLSFELRGSWADLYWPPGKGGTSETHRGVASIESKEGKFGASGTLKSYSFDVDTQFSSSKVPDLQLTAEGTGSDEEISVKSILVSLLNGKITGKGSITWHPEITWEAWIKGQELDPALFAPEWPGNLSLSINTRGTIKDKRKQISFNVDSLKGELRGYPIDGSLIIGVKDDTVDISEVAFRSGGAQFSASGSLSNRWELNWEFQVPDMIELIPGGEGQVGGTGTVKGPRKTPVVTANIEGSGLVFKSLRADTMSFSLGLDLEDMVESSIDLNAEGAHVGDERIESVNVRGEGKMAGHRVSVSVASEKATAELELQGKYSDTSWVGSIERGEVFSSQVGKWLLSEAGPISVESNSVKAGPYCWVNEKASACQELSWVEEKGFHTTGTLKAFPLSTFTPLLPTSFQVDGSMEGEWDIEYAGEDNLKGMTIFVISPGSISYMAKGEDSLSLPLKGGKLDGKIDQGLIFADLNISFTDSDSIRGKGTIPVSSIFHPESEGDPIKGNFQASLSNLAILTAFIPDVEDFRGVFKADLTVGGTANTPYIKGQAGLEGISSSLPRLGINLDEAFLTFKSEGKGTMDIEGKARSNQGTGEISGKIDFTSDKELKANFSIKGERFEAIRTTEIWLLISPDLELSVAGKNVSVKGTLQIPEGTIEPTDLSGAVPLSRDVVIMKESGGEGKKEGYKISSSIELSLGDKIRFDGFGLSGRIRGSLVAVDNPESVTTGKGELEILDGKFVAYGKKLEIERGRLIFAGGPIDDPGLDVRAARKIRDVTAGVEVSGKVKSPRLSLFSNPAMDEADILSFILFGRPSQNASNSEARQLTEAANTTGTIGGDLLAQGIGSLFGLQDVKVEGGNKKEDSTLFIGTYLSPRLYISYGIGLFEPISTYRARYDISSKWFLQTEYGKETGADIFYKIEK